MAIIKAKVVKGKFAKQVKHDGIWWNIGNDSKDLVKVGEEYTFDLCEGMYRGKTTYWANLTDAKPTNVAPVSRKEIEELAAVLYEVADRLIEALSTHPAAPVAKPKPAVASKPKAEKEEPADKLGEMIYPWEEDDED